MKYRIFQLLMVLIFACILAIGCAGGGVKEQKQIATACASIAVAANAIAGAAELGQVSKADARKAFDLASPTKSFCQPKPATSLSPVDYAALLSAAADLALLKKEKVP